MFGCSATGMRPTLDSSSVMLPSNARSMKPAVAPDPPDPGEDRLRRPLPRILIHSTTEIVSDREHIILVSGYTPPMVREWMRNEISPEFVATLPEEIRPLISGSDNWAWRRNYSP